MRVHLSLQRHRSLPPFRNVAKGWATRPERGAPSSSYNPCAMTTKNGAFALHALEDLLKKLKFDMKRLEANPADSYAAFDFFITAFHMKDWANKSGRRIKPKNSNEKVLMDICAQLANGSKHFDIESNEVIKETEHVEGAFDTSFQDNAFQVERLVVHLKGQAAKQLGDIVDATALAQMAVHYWEGKVEEAPSSRNFCNSEK
jgi:hypothetical protein